MESSASYSLGSNLTCEREAGDPWASRDGPVRLQAGLGWQSVSCSRGEEQPVVPVSLAQGLVSEFTEMDAGRPASLGISWLLASLCPSPPPLGLSEGTPMRGERRSNFSFVYVCPHFLERGVLPVLADTPRPGSPSSAIHTSSSQLGAQAATLSSLRERFGSVTKTRATGLCAFVISSNKRVGNTLQQSPLLFHSQNNVSGNELEADLTWILNEKVKGIATHNIPLWLARPDSLSQRPPKERGEQILVLVGETGAGAFIYFLSVQWALLLRSFLSYR